MDGSDSKPNRSIVDHSDAPEIAFYQHDSSAPPEVADDQHYAQRSFTNLPQAAGFSRLEHNASQAPEKQDTFDGERANYDQADYGQANYDQAHYEVPAPTQKRRIAGLSRRRFWAIAIIGLVLVLGIGLGVGLGVGLKRNDVASTPAATTTPAASNATCISGDTYCGWYLITTAGYTSVDLTNTGSSDVYNDLFSCKANNALEAKQSCGGPYSCQAPEYNTGGCSLSLGQSCCSSNGTATG
ncbi:hypothetical protein BJ170DRAFT_160994 [Xylariales sp. AK1849]|nr:hypothetical protein BJ170DRAFT_160994 [Xylariales sp. AK1849]